MRRLARSLVDGWLSLVELLLVAPFAAFRPRALQPFTVERYRPVYSRSGRRNRVRY